MGYTSYSADNRSERATTNAYYTAHVDEIFLQNKLQKIHDLMKPQGIIMRECFDSETHPATVPIILALDVTGSMSRIPHELVKDGLPHIMGTVIQRGVKDASLMFVAIGDHEVDRHPLQVGQFESGDEELDLWLTRTYLEGGGRGNAGESYLLAWYLAAMHTNIDSWNKRKTKGFLFTVGDEPCLENLPSRVVGELMGTPSQKSYTAGELLFAAQEKYNVFHLHILQGSDGHRSLSYWKNLLRQNCIEVSDYREVAKTVADIVTSHVEIAVNTPTPNKGAQPSAVPDKKEDEMML